MAHPLGPSLDPPVAVIDALVQDSSDTFFTKQNENITFILANKIKTETSFFAYAIVNFAYNFYIRTSQIRKVSWPVNFQMHLRIIVKWRTLMQSYLLAYSITMFLAQLCG